MSPAGIGGSGELFPWVLPVGGIFRLAGRAAGLGFPLGGSPDGPSPPFRRFRRPRRDCPVAPLPLENIVPSGGRPLQNFDRRSNPLH